ncbi:hypothetical protein LEP1GSC199_3469 [Leptospira vanthielii serovar Holland str. Waz Holland = ATCC 700522]|uniref:Uncharacterized protein n=1 Tax=Leptospira vanthielii serovar Holland str. Waz Holland = ATCC 700522 TaxID=1218591 RepID=N1W274_9LEPT|nr:hypothetical protein LEP1GSC199_3469 [Leptospira vanthielii serovar Holland str. Waz Holland = ATCC 700522]
MRESKIRFGNAHFFVTDMTLDVTFPQQDNLFLNSIWYLANREIFFHL